MTTEEALFCLHRNRLAEAKAVLPETKSGFISTLVDNFDLVQPAFVQGAAAPGAAPSAADVSMSEAPADAFIAAATPVRSELPVMVTQGSDLFSPIKPVPASPYTPSLFLLPQPRQQPPRPGTF